MSKRYPIPRPRHLFPELAAFLIEWKRTNLRANRQLQRAIGRVPIWITGSLAGLAGIMLTISLFFMHDPELQAASAPTPDPEPQPTLAKPVSPPPETARPNLISELVRTHLPYAWDEESIVSLNSSAIQSQATALAYRDNDHWKPAKYRDSQPATFLSYLTKASGLHQHGNSFVAMNEVPERLAPVSNRSMGILVEKTRTIHGIPHEPLTYEIVVRNRSSEVIENLMVREGVSASHRITEVSPPAGVSGQELIWNFSEFRPGDLKTLKVTLIPETFGEIETLTRIVPTSRVSAVVRVKAPAAPGIEEVLPTLPDQPPEPPPVQNRPLIQVVPGSPELQLTYTKVKALKQGEILSMIFSVKNIGTAKAEDVQLFVRLSGEFEHRYGEFVKHRMGSLQPGQMRRALLQATARDPGNAHVDASLTMQGTEREAYELKIPIQSGRQQISRTPIPDSEPQPTPAKRLRIEREARWIAHEP